MTSRPFLSRLCLLAVSLLLPVLAVQAQLGSGATPGCDPSRQSCAPGSAPAPSPSSPAASANAGPGGVCRPGDAGATCDGSGPASQGNAGGTDTGAGNPINVINGNKYQLEVDMAALPGELGLELVRHYNSANARVIGALGAGWRLSYETELYVIGQTIQVLQADGTRLIFDIDAADPSHCTGADPAAGHIQIRHGRSASGQRQREYIWYWTHGPHAGRKLHFNAAGKLEQIVAASGAVLTVQRGPAGELLRITDPQGRSLKLNWASRADVARAQAQQGGGYFAGVQSIDTPLGRFAYRHGGSGDQSADASRAQAANLVEVAVPTHVEAGRQAHPWANRSASSSSVRRLYHYEDAQWPQMLTGISVQGAGSDGQQQDQRLSTYLYNARGQAILSVKGRPAELARDASGQPLAPARLQEGSGQEQVTLQYLEPALPTRAGTTLLANSLGQHTVYRHQIIAGQFRLLEARGAGCARCGPVNMRYDYDALGRMTGWQQLAPTRIEPGQPPPLARVIASARFELDAQGNIVQGNAGGPPEQARYDDARWPDKPTHLSRPSVVPGRRHELRLVYNDAGQLTELSERGWSPVNANGEPEPTAIERSTRYRYERINGRSVLVEVDGPLANGPRAEPGDSDITRYQWDERGSFITGVTSPGGYVTNQERDIAGRVVLDSLNDGYRQIDTLTEYAGQASIALERVRISRVAQLLEHGKPQPTSRLEQTILHAQHDALGRRSVLIDASGRRTQVEYDGPNQLPVQLSRGDGSNEHYARDSESQLVAELRLDPQQQLVAADLWLRDWLGRTVAHAVPQGLQAIFVYGGDSAGAAAAGSVPSAGLLKTAMRQVTIPGDKRQAVAPRQQDDFGRTVLEQLPEDGRVTTVYAAESAGERQTQIRIGVDGRQQLRESLLFDHAGRLMSRERGMVDQVRCRDTLHYEGPLLKRLEACNASTEYERNAWGQITVERTLVGGVLYAQQYDYDDKGRLRQRGLVASTSTSAPQLSYRYGNHGATEAVALLRPRYLHARRLLGTRAADTLANWLPGDWSRAQLIEHVQRESFGARLQALEHGNGTRQDWQTSIMRAASDQSEGETVHAELLPTALTQRTPSDGAVIAPRDGYGRQTLHVPVSGSNRGKAQRLIWNDAHQLSEVRDAQSGEPIARYTYDASGNRIRKIASGRTTIYLYDTRHRLIAEARQDGGVERHYLYSDHRVHSLVEQEGDRRAIYAVHTDWRGLPTQVLDDEQRVHWRMQFDPWGRPLTETSTTAVSVLELNLRLAGQYWDAETGLHYNIHRYYDPARGVYLSPDPLGASDGPDRYAYLNGDPFGGIDPLGLFKVPARAFTGGTILANNSDFIRASAIDGGHGQILMTAFSLYHQQVGEVRFSNAIIDQIIVNNYYTDTDGVGAGSCYPIVGLPGGGQCKESNHFDNPNTPDAGAPFKVQESVDPATGKPIYSNTGEWRETYTNTSWIADTVAELEENRARYAAVAGKNVSLALNAFGRNSHTLADFYAHSNWVDNVERGGCWARGKADGITRGWVPRGLDRRMLWDEGFDGVPFEDIYTGTVASVVQVSVARLDKSTHAYWNKDQVGKFNNEELKTENQKNMTEYSIEERKEFGKDGLIVYPVKLDYRSKSIVLGEPRAVQTRAEMAYYLAIQHTIQEIDKLWQAAAGEMVGDRTLQDVFRMDLAPLVGLDIVYTDLYPRN